MKARQIGSYWSYYSDFDIFIWHISRIVNRTHKFLFILFNFYLSHTSSTIGIVRVVTSAINEPHTLAHSKAQSALSSLSTNHTEKKNQFNGTATNDGKKLDGIYIKKSIYQTKAPGNFSFLFFFSFCSKKLIPERKKNNFLARAKSEWMREPMNAKKN
jgi:hypothetical protein